MLETGILRDYAQGQYTTWFYLRTHLHRSGERRVRTAFRERFSREPWIVRRLNYVTWVAGPLAEEEAR